MRSEISAGLAVAALFLSQVQGQSATWGQCGGIGWTGPTTCTAGNHCYYDNDWYSQCVPGTASSSTSKASTSSTTSKASTSTSSSKSSTSSVSTSHSSTLSTSTTAKVSSTTSVGSCTAAFTPVSASAAVAALNPMWNLGNSLDAIPDETSWGNPAVQASTFTDIKGYGYNGVRLPVTWNYHLISGSPSWTINSTWLTRVETVVDQAIAAGLYAIINVHHDSWIWADVTQAGANYTRIEEEFAALWLQIGTKFACHGSKLIFETINEPPGTTQAHATEINKLQDLFLTSINNAGGYNPKRVVSLTGLGDDSVKTSQWFSRGTLYPNQPWFIQFHYYSPYDFIFDAWGKTIWGSDADKAALDSDFSLFKGNFSTIPTLIGEWDASTANTEEAGRWKYLDFLLRTANKYGFSTAIWDNGGAQYNRVANTWYDPIDLSIMQNAVKGTINALADSTADPSTTSQNSSAYLFHKVGDPVIAQSVTYLLNGRTLTSIKTSTGATVSTSSYSMTSAGVLTFTSAYLSTLYTSTASAGIKAVLTLAFSGGSPLSLTIVQYSTPTVATSTYTVNPSADLVIPVTWNGIGLAAVKAVLADGTYLADTWTVYLGPLQQARWTYGNWGWSLSGGTFTVYAAGLTIIQAAGQTVTLTVEAFPRSVGQNSFNITLNQ